MYKYLSGISPVNQLNTFFSSETINIKFIGVSATMPFLFGPSLVKLHSLKCIDKETSLRFLLLLNC